jgi:general secretion pathway protein F
VPSFHYVASGPGNAARRGRIDAADRAAALAELDRMGLDARTLSSGPAGSIGSLLSLELGSSGVAPGALRSFTRELALLLDARIGLARALSLLVEESSREFARLPLVDLLRRVEIGESLADAMAAHPRIFQPDYLGIVRVGQASGTLGTAMGDIAHMLERRAAQRSRLLGALTYPAVLLLASVGTIAVLVQVVLPSFAPLFERAGLELPWTTRVVLAFADAAPAMGVAAIVTIVVAVLAWIAAGRDPASRRARDRRVLFVPVIGPVLQLDALSSAMRALGIMTRGGLLLRSALAIASGGTRNAAIAGLLADMADALERGERLSDRLRAAPEVPAAVPRLVRVGEESGELSATFLHLADLLDAKLRQRIDRGTALITPALTLVVGGVIAFVLIAVMSALLGANELVVA